MRHCPSSGYSRCLRMLPKIAINMNFRFPVLHNQDLKLDKGEKSNCPPIVLLDIDFLLETRN